MIELFSPLEVHMLARRKRRTHRGINLRDRTERSHNDNESGR